MIRAGGGRDLIDAGSGRDTVYGEGGTDVVYGGPQADEIVGGPGADVIRAGQGGDDLEGGSGEDVLVGQDGNDDLVGGLGADEINGGAGTNWCTIDSQDDRTRCKYDREVPRAGAVELSRTVVDVSNETQRVTVRIHLFDDTGVKDAHLGLNDDTGAIINVGYAYLRSGDARDGWWEQTAVVRRWSVPGTFTVSAYGRDRVGHRFSRSYTDSLRVIDRNPDTVMPDVSLLRPASDAVYDVRDSARTVVVEARITDALSGVDDAVPFCLHKPQDGYYTTQSCWNATLSSGTRKNGIWRSALRIPEGATGGDWNVEVHATDEAHPYGHVRWMGPDMYKDWTNDGTIIDPWVRQFPAGVGRFSVRGTTDSFPARITSVQIDPSTVDTLPGPAEVRIKVRASDVAGEGVTGVGAALTAPGTDDNGPQWPPQDFVRTSGTKLDGIWETTFELPQGTPPGTYHLQVWVEDARHWRSYTSPDSPTYQPGDVLIPGDRTVVVVDQTG